ncbi:DUF4406 domain-containing protein [Paraburkholderia phymatum]|uniref:DUF4406 domain-containing protein n=1 Tax=Paraburkholderia phymatum (strain DSM 17167 / CIP 108236 / LMG 21445 / STM815) TaxID=391038 RepID=B2JD24_PARP8|nr:DUF4406 domain-containing protein [Paraburkholderia phymatum]ACC71080.1 hypothetical protein Bphy_1901 [Paraburkholderia phymatum STM815]
MKLYLSGPMTGLPDLNKPAFHAEAARLEALGFEVENPALVDLGPFATWLDYMRVDIKLAVDCDGIAMLPGWEQSRGAPIERNLLRDLGLPVYRASTIIGLAAGMVVLSADVLAPADAEAA